MCTSRSVAQTPTNGSNPKLPAEVQATNVARLSEKQLLAVVPQLEWTLEYMVSNGWLKAGQNIRTNTNYFSKKNYRLLGISGEIQFLYDRTLFGGKKPFFVGFWVEGEDDFAALYRAMKKAALVPEKRSGEAGSSSRIDWRIEGATNHYEVGLVRRVLGRRLNEAWKSQLRARLNFGPLRPRLV
jgi:hypothetical protein